MNTGTLVDALNALRTLPGDHGNDIQESTAILESSARYIAQNLDERLAIVQELQARLDGLLWGIMGQIWTILVGGFASKDMDLRGEVEERLIALALAFGKMERNLVAGIEEHQAAAIAHEPLIRSLLFHITTFSRIEDEKYFQLQAIITQLLSNMISPIRHDQYQIVDRLLPVYLSGMREDDVISRLLDSQDVKINLATLHLVNNITRSSQSRCKTILSSTPGLTWLSRLLDKLEIFHQTSDGRFELCTQIFAAYINMNLHPRLFGALASKNEPISPSQTAFLKVVDSYTSSRSEDADVGLSQCIFLVPPFHVLSTYCNLAMVSGQDDPRLPKVFEGLHLVCEILCTIGLAVQARLDSRFRGEQETSDSNDGADVVKAMKSADDCQGLVKSIISLLQRLEVFLPRTNPRLSRLNPTFPLIPPDQARPIAQLKRILVQLLGVLTFGDTQVGDQVREAGGVQLLLGMTEVDEGNPYLREHALLVVRNLMLDNPENQKIIAQMDPVGVLGQDGEVLPVPERMQRDR